MHDVNFANRLARLEETLELLDQKLKRIYPEKFLEEEKTISELREMAELLHDIHCANDSCDWYRYDWDSEVHRTYIQKAKYLKEHAKSVTIDILVSIKDAIYKE